MIPSGHLSGSHSSSIAGEGFDYWISRTRSHFTHQAAMLNFGSASATVPFLIFPMFFRQWKKGSATMGRTH